VTRWLAFAGVALVLACTPVTQSREPPRQEPALAAEAIVARDGYALPVRVWRAEGAERAVAIALHGFNDYSNAFAMPGEWWAERGVTTYAYDQRGFGATAQPGIWAGVDAMIDDLEDAARVVRARHPGRPLFLVGESMGGAIIMAAAASANPGIEADGLVLAAPAVWGRSTMPWLYRQSLRFFAHVAPWYPLSGQGLGIRASDNIEMLRALGRDPRVIKETRADALWGLADAMDAGLDAAPRLRQPLLLLYGARDEIIPRAPVERMVGELTAPYRVAVYPKGWHMLFRDLQRETVWTDALSWMLDKAAPLPSGQERTNQKLFEER
jgi:alpha-beta hydrolase superfamily lysophospholipase